MYHVVKVAELVWFWVIISDEAKFLTFSVVTLCDNKQAIYGIFPYVPSTTIHLQTAYYQYSGKIIVDAGSSQRNKSWSSHIHSTLLQVKRKLLTVKFPDTRAFFELFPDKNFNTEIPDMSGKFRTYRNPNLTLIDPAPFVTHHCYTYSIPHNI